MSTDPMSTDPVPAPPIPADDPLQGLLGATAVNLSEQARRGKLRETYGRDDEVVALLDRLARGAKASPLVVGPPRVGKTAVIHAAVARMARGECPEALAGVTVYALSPAQLVLDFGNDWATQVQSFLRDAAARPDVLLYWRDLPGPSGAQSKKDKEDGDFLPLLVEHLQGGELRCLAELRDNALRRIAAGNPEIDEVFTTLRVDEPPADRIAAIVSQAAGDLEIEHGVPIEPAAREAAISLAGRFNVAQAFPGKAIELIEEAAIQAALRGAGEAAVTAPLVASHFSARTGLSRQITDESLAFDEAEVRRSLAEHVIGQEQAIESLVQTLCLLKARLNDPHRPLGVFLFLGPTGVGKTELSKALGEWLFGDASRLVRFNMADYSGNWDYVKLFGDSDPDEDLATRRGQLTVRLAEEPFAVLLLDEFEKANGNIFLRFMQLFDEGLLHNGDGEMVNLRNCIIIATSNFGANPKHIGFIPQSSDEDAQTEIERDLERALERAFTPEFINRLDSVCFFKPLGKLALHRIARRDVDLLFKREGIARRGLEIEMDEEVIEHVVERGYSPKFGARHLKRQIERAIAYPLARAILGQPTRPSDLVRVFVRRGRVQAALVPDEADRAPRPDEAVVIAEDPRRRFTLAELRAALPGVQARVARIAAFHTLEAVRAEAQDRMAAMSDPAFWDDPQRAEADLAALGALTRVVDLCDGLARAAADMAAALALVDERGERSMIGEAARQYRYLLAELPPAELDLLLTEPWDRQDAFLLLHAVPGDGPGAAAWAESLFGAYLAWAGRRGFEVAVIDETRAPSGDLVSAGAAIRGHGAYGLLRGEAGAHRWLQHRPDGGREVAHARVEVAPDPQPGAAATAGDEVQVQSRPTSGRGKHLGKLRSQATATHLPSETSLTITSDQPADASRALAGRLVALLAAARARRRADPAPAPDAEALWGAVIRTYCTYKNPYVRDMRTGVSDTNVRRVLEGHLDPFIEASLRASAGTAEA